MLKVNLGCGKKILKGWVNVDKYYSAKGIVKADITKKLPFKDYSVDVFLMDNVLEHIDDPLSLIRECHRKLKKRGKLVVIAPHYSHLNFWADPTHKKTFAARSFFYFKKDFYCNYYIGCAFSNVRVHLIFQKSLITPWNYVIEPVANLFKIKNIHVWEFFPLFSVLFPIEKVQADLIK